MTNSSNDEQYSQPVIKAFQYSSSSELNSYIYSTEYNTYSGGGYVYHLRGTLQNITASLNELENTSWIDRNTRAVFLTFSLYNPNVNLFVYCSLLMEYIPSIGSLVPRASFQPFKLVQLYTNGDLIYCLVYLLIVIYYIYIEIRFSVKLKKSYFKRVWSYINWTMIVCSWVGVGIHFIRQNELNRLGQIFKMSHSFYPVNLQFASYLNNILIYQIGFCCFFATIKSYVFGL